MGVIAAHDMTYDKYVASRDYRAKDLGVGGNLSRTRFEQLKASVVPFDVKRFKQLVNSMAVIYLDWRRFGLAVALQLDLDLDSFILTLAWRGLKLMELLAHHSLIPHRE